MNSNDAPVAIVGIGGIFPGAHDFEEFWANITNAHDAAREVDPKRWIIPIDDAYDPAIAEPDHVYSKRGCFIDEIPRINTAGIDIGADFLAGLDPSFHLLLHAGLQAFRDAATAELDRSRTGIIIGNLALPTDSAAALAREYLGRTLEEKVLGQSRINGSSGTNPLNRYVTGLPAGVLAKALGLGGGTLTLDAACSSSLYALKLAVDELVSGRADAMLTGGLSRPDSLYTQMGFSQLRALSPSGTCSPFDEKGDGLVVGEGAGILVLKRCEDAVRDGDHIYAVIRGIGLSNDIGGGLLAPMSEGQLRAMRAAYAQAGLEPQDIDLVECHATGTPVGDAVEVESLRALWGSENWTEGQCVIGSVKSNVGHLLTAAGSAALIKTLLALKEKTLPPTANFRRSTPALRLEDSPFQVLTTSRPWRKRDDSLPRRAAVSAFGFGGINAHVILEEWEDDRHADAVHITEVSAPSETIDVAVVGMDAYFGPWTSLRKFQERILGSGIDAEPETPEHWWGAQSSAWFRLQGLAHYPFKGHFIRELPVSPDQFRIPPKELEEMLPQQLLMLKVAAGALADSAAIDSEAFDSLKTGVFIGIGLDLNTTNFNLRWSLIEKARKWADTLGLDLTAEEFDDWVETLRDASGPALTANRTMGGLGSIIASRIAREFRLGGPSFALSSEESSGIRALEMGVRAIQRGELDRAVVGAVDLAGDVRAVLATHRGRAYSASGNCRPFDERADGPIIGEGAAAVVLKPLDRALRDKDKIYAVVKGIGVAGGGAVESLVPDGKAYLEAARRAYDEADVDIANVGFIEAHGSGSPEEDLMEARALTRLFKENGDKKTLLSSAKADIGHTGAASGLAAFVKTCICLYQEVLPPLRHFGRARAELAQPGHRLFAAQQAQYWFRNRAEGPRTAGMSSFSVDGNCTHVVLASYEYDVEMAAHADRLQPMGVRPEGLFVVEANNVPALEVGLARLRAHVEQKPNQCIEALARRWWRANREDNAKSRGIALIARNGSELLDQIDFVVHALTEDPERALSGKAAVALPPIVRDRVFFSPEPLSPDGKVAFVFPGSGNQYLGMGRELAVQWPEIYRKQDAENAYLLSQFQPQVFWNSESIGAVSKDHKAALFGQVALGTAASDLIQSFGVRPEAVIGYSLGEMAGLFALKAWTGRDEMLKRINASTLFTEDLAGEYRAARSAWKVPSTKTVDWALGVIDRPAKVVRAALTDHKKVYSLIVNTLHECVIGGDPHAVEKLVRKLDCEFFPLQGVTTVHCEVAKEVQEPYRELHVMPTTEPRDIRFYSGSWGTDYNVSSESAADSVLAQAIYGIDYPRVIESAYTNGVRLFLEMGPGGSCSRMIGEILADRPHVARSLCVQGQDAVSTVLRMLGHLIAERVPVDLSVLYGLETSLTEHREQEEPVEQLVVAVGGDPFDVILPERLQSPEPDIHEVSSDPTHEPLAQPAAPLVQAAPVPAVEITVHAEALPQIAALAIPGTDVLLEQWQAAESIKAEAHASYLRFAQTTSQALSEALSFQMSLLESLNAGTATTERPIDDPPMPPSAPVHSDAATVQTPMPTPDLRAVPTMDREQCMEFAIGSIGKSLGPDYAEIDTHPTRVRLPDEPLMLVDRILSFHGEARSLGSGRVVTEHDVLPGAWYLDAGRMPVCIAVEAGQADLILSAYLGIDFRTRGEAVYRLLDAVITFHRPLARPGETIHYDIRIERFFRQGETHLFRFNYDATVNGQPLLTMRNGCAGFFTREELDQGAGIVRTALDLEPAHGVRSSDWTELVPMSAESYSDEQVDALRRGDLPGCFGPHFDDLRLRDPFGLPGGRMKLVDRILELDPRGGRFGLGRIRGEMDVHPDDWFLTCHFVDDMVMPGTLMYECCLHTLRIFVMRMGWVGEVDQVAFEPVEGVSGQLKCRGEVNCSSAKVIYEVDIKEIGYGPAPFVIADTLMYVDGKPAVEMKNMSLQLTGLTQEFLNQLWGGKAVSPLESAAPLFGYDQILAFATGNPSDAFGDRYKIFDHERAIARLPRPPYQFLDRIVAIDHEQWLMKAGGEIVAEYDVPPDAWYFDSDRRDEMSFAVLLEVALQPCGWFAAYMGSALTSDEDLRFRNLGGKAVQHQCVRPDAGTLATRVRCTSLSSSGGMIIQHYAFDVSCGGAPVYTGETYFGYFSKKALADQIGLREAKLHAPTESERSVHAPFSYPTDAPYPDATLRMVDCVEVFDPKGGPNNLGFIRATIEVDPAKWFFEAHFYQDPVWPGSLGLEGFVQLLRYVAVERWAVGPKPTLEIVALDEEHRWTYRGQILPSDDRVTIEAAITEIDDERQLIRADGFLSVDGRIIYQMNDFAVRLRKV